MRERVDAYATWCSQASPWPHPRRLDQRDLAVPDRLDLGSRQHSPAPGSLDMIRDAHDDCAPELHRLAELVAARHPDRICQPPVIRSSALRQFLSSGGARERDHAHLPAPARISVSRIHSTSRRSYHVVYNRNRRPATRARFTTAKAPKTSACARRALTAQLRVSLIRTSNAAPAREEACRRGDAALIRRAPPAPARGLVEAALPSLRGCKGTGTTASTGSPVAGSSARAMVSSGCARVRQIRSPPCFMRMIAEAMASPSRRRQIPRNARSRATHRHSAGAAAFAPAPSRQRAAQAGRPMD